MEEINYGLAEDRFIYAQFSNWVSMDYWISLSDVILWNGLALPINYLWYSLLFFLQIDNGTTVKSLFGFTGATWAYRIMMFAGPLAGGINSVGVLLTMLTLPLYLLLSLTWAPIGVIIKLTDTATYSI
jgi:hypothetical protein